MGRDWETPTFILRGDWFPPFLRDQGSRDDAKVQMQRLAVGCRSRKYCTPFASDHIG